MPNRLIHETSPYLLQHADNPVDWYAWGDEALGKAKKENKPILVSIGYSACHWCHVMEKESFEDEETAAIMNEHFVNIKVDREERPDIDHIYMDAVQTLTGSGGWPLNVFLTPVAKPFYGGTYFPPKRAYNRLSWKEVLMAVSDAFRQKRDEVDLQAENLIAHLQQSNSLATQKAGETASVITKEKIDEAFQNLIDIADQRWGGFGPAPKFPQTFSIQFLLRYYHVTKNASALKQATLSLDKMIEGGIYDQLGGGFARYSTDKEWLAPHFEKMLYDNALLVSSISEAYQVTRSEKYKNVISETITFIQRELMNREGGFYAALDADSEGEEGKYYVWQYDEVTKLLGSDAALFCEFFDITQIGNWEGKSILRIKQPLELFAEEKHWDPAELKAKFQQCKDILLEARSKRIRPQLDDKILLGWNALMNTACSKAFGATGEERYREMAVANMQFLLSHFTYENEEKFRHTAKGDSTSFAFLDDYACMIQALIHLHEITGDLEWINRAGEVSEYVVKNFSDLQSGFFFFTDITQPGLVLRKKEIYDGATPSGNATMAYNIYRLSIVLDIPAWKKRAFEMVASLGNTIIRYPGSFGIWLNLVLEMVVGTSEIAVVGKEALKLGEQVLKEYIPHKVLMISAMGNEKMPMLVGKAEKDISLVYLCKAYSCLKPVSAIPDLLELLHEGN